VPSTVGVCSANKKENNSVSIFLFLKVQKDSQITNRNLVAKNTTFKK
jgi:hypothetical protein